MRNIVLIGFMGTGKTSTGKILASKLGCAFVDMDLVIEEKNGMSISDMFAKHGEAYFRQKEKELVAELAGKKNQVISTGGGTVKDPENIAKFSETGCVVALSASVDAILERTGRRGTRPVLDGADQGDRRKAIEELLESRKGMYSKAGFTVDTSELAPMQVADKIISHLKKEGALRA